MTNLTPEMIEKAKAAKSAEELLEIAKANNVEMTADEAATYFAQLNPKSGELDEDDLDAVAGAGGCGKKPTLKFAVGDHVIKRGLYNCDGGLFGNCQSRYWVVKAFIDYEVQGIHYRCSCPVCGIVTDISESSLQKVD